MWFKMSKECNIPLPAVPSFFITEVPVTTRLLIGFDTLIHRYAAKKHTSSLAV